MEKKLYFFGGKGGTGKTSLSSTFALTLARKGKKTLAVSTDPAHSLADAFDTKLNDSPKRLEPNLDALEIDAGAEARRYVDRIRSSMTDIVSPAIVEDLNKQLDLSASSPGSEEAALFDRFTDLMKLAGSDYDAVVFDTAPTGHTLRLLRLPELMGFWMNRLMARRGNAMELIKVAAKYEPDLKERLAHDPIYETLSRRQRQFEEAKRLLTDKAVTTFFPVMVAEKMPLLETQRAVAGLAEAGVPLGPIIVNRLLPEDTGDYFAPLRAKQAHWLEETRKTFASLGVVTVPWLPGDVEGVADLEALMPYLAELV